MIARQLAFARRIPASKLIARISLLGKRHLLSRAAPLVPAIGTRRSPAPLADALPDRLFERSARSIETIDGDAVAFTFLNERREFTFPIHWHSKELKRRNHLWLLNLHYMEYLAEVDDALFERLVLDWIAGNPGYCPGYWSYNWNSYALSIRTVTIMKEVARRRAGLTHESLELIRRSLWNQIHFLERNLETDILGNHIIKNIKALAWASAFFRGSQAERWRKLATRLLDREIGAQILPDGVHYERSPSYHAQVFSDLLETRHVLGGDPLDGRLDAGLSLMAQALADLTHPDGGVALFNDSGLHMSRAPSECLRLWRDSTGASVRARDTFAFAEGGYYGVRKPHWCVIVDMGSIGPDDLPAHAHGDVGSFELSVRTGRLIVDQGVFEYSAGERRDRSRTAASHNVLHIEGGDQAEFYGSFRCGRRPRVESSFQLTSEGFVLNGVHDGYADANGEPLVERTIEVDENRISFHDRISGDCRAPASINFLLHPKTQVEQVDDATILRREGSGFALVTDLETSMEEAVYWPDMGVELETRRIRLKLAFPTREARWELRHLGTGTSA